MTNPRLVIAGLPRGLCQLLSSHQIAIDGWDLRLVPSRNHNQADFDSDVANRALREATSGEHGGHVLAFSTSKGRESFVSDLSRHVRFRWLKPQYLFDARTDIHLFIGAIRGEAKFEQDWRDAVELGDASSALLLPECSFRPIGHGEMWTLCRTAAPASPPVAATRFLDRAKDKIKEFTRVHRPEGVWQDSARIRFDGRGPRHGVAPDLWDWKFSWKVPPGFHFDVQHADARAFSLMLFGGRRVLVPTRGYRNVDCHGRLRGD